MLPLLLPPLLHLSFYAFFLMHEPEGWEGAHSESSLSKHEWKGVVLELNKLKDILKEKSNEKLKTEHIYFVLFILSHTGQ